MRLQAAPLTVVAQSYRRGSWADVAAAWLVLALLEAAPGGTSAALGLAVASWYAMLVLRLALDSSGRPLSLLALAFTAYSTSAWVAVTRFDVVYLPFPSLEAIEEGTVLSLRVVVLSFLLLRMLPLDLSTERFSSAATRTLEATRTASGLRLSAACAFLLAIAAHDGSRLLALGLDVVLAASRRELKGELLAESNHNVQVVAVAASIALGLVLVDRGPRSRASVLGLVALAAYWSPVLAIGARKTLLVAAGAVVLAALLRVPPIRHRASMLALCAAAAVALFLLPLVRTPQLDQASIEFVYPQYFLFEGIEQDLELPYGYGRGAWLMLPAFLRARPVSDLGSLFKELEVTTVGIGAHPVGEAYAVSPRFALPLAVIATVAIVLAVATLARLNEAWLLLGAVHLLLWGRSDFWVTLFFVCYQGLALWWFLGGLPVVRDRASSGYQSEQSERANEAQR